MEAILEDHSTSIDAFVTDCHPVDGQVGAVFAVNDSIVAIDLFDRPSTLRRMLPKLVRSVVDAIDVGRVFGLGDVGRVFRPGGDGGRSFSSGEATVVPTLAQQFLAVTSTAPQHTAKALGLGGDVRLTAPLAGAALVVDQEVIHLSAFAL